MASVGNKTCGKVVTSVEQNGVAFGSRLIKVSSAGVLHRGNTRGSRVIWRKCRPYPVRSGQSADSWATAFRQLDSHRMVREILVYLARLEEERRWNQAGWGKTRGSRNGVGCLVGIRVRAVTSSVFWWRGYGNRMRSDDSKGEASAALHRRA